MSTSALTKGIREMQLSHDGAAVSTVFDEANLVSCAGLAPVMALAERAGLHELVGEHVTVSGAAASAPVVKVTCLVAGMVAGADSIDDMDLLRHGAMRRLFGGVRAPSTLGSFLRCFTFGHVRQLDAVASRFLTGLAANTPVLAGADTVAYVDVDDTVRATYGYAKQGSGFGYSGVKGLNVLLAAVSTPTCAPVVAATRLRKGSAASVRGSARLVSDALATARACGADPKKGALVTVRTDSAFYAYDVIAAARRAGAHFSVTARSNPTVKAAIATIEDSAWTPIHYPEAFIDQDTGQLVSDAEVAEVPFTAFTSRRKSQHITARLIVRRVKRLGPAPGGTPPPGALTTPQAGDTATTQTTSEASQTTSQTTVAGFEQAELFSLYRFHAVFTDSPLSMLEAEISHRRHAIIEKVIEDLKGSALAHLPSGRFDANAAWVVLAAIAFNLTRAAAALSGTLLARAATATIRAKLINIPGRLARSARRLTLHLPIGWPWQTSYERLADQSLTPLQKTTAITPPSAA